MKTTSYKEFCKLSAQDQLDYIGILSDFGAYIYVEKYLQPHRLDGPAKIWPDGLKEYYIHGTKLTEKDYFSNPEVLKRINNSKEFKDVVQFKSVADATD